MMFEKRCLHCARPAGDTLPVWRSGPGRSRMLGRGCPSGAWRE